MSLVTAPELTKCRAVQPRDASAVKVNSSEEVLVHVSGGIELASKPGLNIIGGLQPRGPKVICGIPDMALIVELPVTTDSVEDEAPVIIEVIAEDIELMSDIVVPADGAAVWSDLFRMLIDMVFVPIGGIDVAPITIGTVSGSCGSLAIVDWRPSPGPAWRILSGKHWTLPFPFAKRLSTHWGNAPVLKYSSYISSESR